MPEIITPAISGVLAKRDNPRKLAKAIIRVLTNDEIFLHYAARAPEIAAISHGNARLKT